jgi:hypothetical protein
MNADPVFLYRLSVYACGTVVLREQPLGPLDSEFGEHKISERAAAANAPSATAAQETPEPNASTFVGVESSLAPTGSNC